MTDNILNREILATEYVKQSGKAIHSSDCATSRAPAEVPGPCDCEEPQEETGGREGMNTFKPQAELTVILRKTQAIEQCDADVAAIKAGTSNIFRYDVSEPYFHQLRFHIESDPELAKKVSVSYVNEKEEILPITVADSLRWPPNFLTECWDIEARIHKVRREKVQAGAEPDSRAEAATEKPEKDPRTSQNQTVSSGVEGAHEGTTADKNAYDESTDFCEKLLSSSLAPTRTPQLRDSREPEKLNNAHKDVCDARCDHTKPALAESSLSSPPPKVYCSICGGTQDKPKPVLNGLNTYPCSNTWHAAEKKK